MIKFDVHNRFTGAVQFTAEIDCADDAPTSVKLGLAVRWAIKVRADLAGANLAGAYLARAYLAGANLAGANLTGANLTGAYLTGAYLTDADLTGANLTGANLTGAYLTGANIKRLQARATRSDGFEFLLWRLESGWRIIAGCRSMASTAEYRAHIAASYPDTPKAAETGAILAFFDARIAQDAEPSAATETET
jgi:hypothetical protein